MALRSALDEAEAREVLSAYGLRLESIAALPALGTVNSNFRVEASGERWFLRINEGKTDADVDAEAELVSTLRAHGLPTPAVTRTIDGAWRARAAGKPVTLFPWVDGHEAEPRAESPETVRVAGEALRLLHRAGQVVAEAAMPRNHYVIGELRRRLQSFAGDPRFAEVAHDLEGELATGETLTGPEGLIHQDLFPDNLLVDGSGGLAAVLDLEQATRGRLLYDLAVSANAWCWDGARVRMDAVDAMLSAYGGPIDRAAFVKEARLAAARFTITRITDIALADNVDPDLQRRKDWRDYARRLAFWRAFNASTWG
ncbi:MAG TPA: homoserine kinase [Kofleriaceae bacterium]|nr:homoserine kinase [Kofleriaceae bacterium]